MSLHNYLPCERYFTTLITHYYFLQMTNWPEGHFNNTSPLYSWIPRCGAAQAQCASRSESLRHRSATRVFGGGERNQAEHRERERERDHVKHTVEWTWGIYNRVSVWKRWNSPEGVKVSSVGTLQVSWFWMFFSCLHSFFLCVCNLLEVDSSSCRGLMVGL